jgi:hypothetical protein
LFVVQGEKGEEVERVFQKALELDPNSPGIYNDLSTYYAAVNNKEQVRGTFFFPVVLFFGFFSLGTPRKYYYGFPLEKECEIGI